MLEAAIRPAQLRHMSVRAHTCAYVHMCVQADVRAGGLVCVHLHACMRASG